MININIIIILFIFLRLFIHRYSQVDQIFFGSLHPIITEDVLLNSVDFGKLIHIEVKHRTNQTTNYGFATVLDSKKEIERLIQKRNYVVIKLS